MLEIPRQVEIGQVIFYNLGRQSAIAGNLTDGRTPWDRSNL